VSKETYYSVKRDLLQCPKRPATVSKETYYSVKRDLLQCQKRPTTVSKETYYSVVIVKVSMHVRGLRFSLNPKLNVNPLTCLNPKLFTNLTCLNPKLFTV